MSTATATPEAEVLLRAPGHARFPLADGMRAIAALMVLCAHAAFLSDQDHGAFGAATTPLGTQGVSIFFLLSGFLLYRPFVAAREGLGPPPRLAAFWRNRLLRILPAYWFALTALSIYPGVSDVFSERWWHYYTLTQPYTRFTAFHGLGPAWSLAVELSFYLVLPGLAWLAARSGRRGEVWGLVVLGLLALVVHAALGSHMEQRYLQNMIWGSFTWFALGMGLALASVAQAQDRLPAPLAAVARRPGACWLAAAGGFAAMTTLLGIPALRDDLIRIDFGQSLTQQILFSVNATLILIPAVLSPPAGVPARILALRPMAWLGLISYGIFLWHYNIAAWFSQSGVVNDGPLPRFPALLACTLVGALTMGAVSFYFVERPFLALKRTRLRLGTRVA